MKRHKRTSFMEPGFENGRRMAADPRGKRQQSSMNRSKVLPTDFENWNGNRFDLPSPIFAKRLSRFNNFSKASRFLFIEPGPFLTPATIESKCESKLANSCARSISAAAILSNCGPKRAEYASWPALKGSNFSLPPSSIREEDARASFVVQRGGRSCSERAFMYSHAFEA